MVDGGNIPRLTLMTADDYERQRSMRLRRKNRYRTTHKDYRVNHHGPGDTERKRSLSKMTELERPFIMWDGEGPKDTAYSLFGNSAGYEVCYPNLSSNDCLSLITQTGREHPRAIHISFGFNYDVSMIIKDMPRRAHRALAYWGKCQWRCWSLEHIPHKWFKVTYEAGGEKVTVKIYDIHTFFHGRYDQCLESFKVGTPEELADLAAGKDKRVDFVWADIEYITRYWRLELRLGVQLGNELRRRLNAANYLPRSWHGPGALARMALKRHDVYKAMAICPPKVREAARFAYAGGRFDQYIIGEVNSEVYEYDINSAYPHYATQLPNLSRGKWRHGCKYEPGKFAVYHIRYTAPANPHRVYPLFYRSSDYMVCFPNRVDGWYWSPEANLVCDDPDAVFLEAWIFDEEDESDRPFAWLAQYFHQRKMLDKVGDPVGYSYKILINAIYGQLAQRAGWDRKTRTAPRSHQLEWAGFITSSCRAAVYRAAIACGDKLISINTDSVQSLVPLDDVVPTGTALGEWEGKTYSGGLFWQAGIYYLREELGYDLDLNYGWIKARTRGIPKGKYNAEDILIAIRTQTPLEMIRNTFITYRTALLGQWELRNTWKSDPDTFAFGGGPGSKRVHFKCTEGCRQSVNGIHRTCGLPPIRNDIKSHPHYLPWLEEESEIKEKIDAWMIELEEEDLEYAEA
jgi:DNA polymerase type B, organellar and viral